MRKYDLVMFDFDGTLVDSKQFHIKVFYRFLSELLGEIDMEIVERWVGDTVRNIFLAAGIPEDRHEETFRKLDDFCRGSIDDLAGTIGVAGGAFDTLTLLRNGGATTAVITNSMQAVVDRVLTLQKLMPLFDCVTGADFWSANKAIRTDDFAKTTGIPAERTLYIGDTGGDIAMARELGYKSCLVRSEIGFDRDFDSIIKNVSPDYVIDRLPQLAELVL